MWRWRWEDLKMRRCDDKMWWQTSAIRRTLRSDALGKNNHFIRHDVCCRLAEVDPLRLPGHAWYSGGYGRPKRRLGLALAVSCTVSLVSLVSQNGGSPIAGWFLYWNIFLKLMLWGTTTLGHLQINGWRERERERERGRKRERERERERKEKGNTSPLILRRFRYSSISQNWIIQHSWYSTKHCSQPNYQQWVHLVDMSMHKCFFV